MTTRTRERPASRRLFAPAVIGALLAATMVAGTARADDVTGAANAFSRAQKAELSNDFAAAAEFYELADSLAPAPEALRSALRSRKAAGQLEIAAVHAEELLERYAAEAKSTELANATLEEAAKKLMRFEATCRPSPCTLLVDGAAASADAKGHHVVYLAPGKHEVRAAFGSNRTDAQPAEGAAGDRGSLSFDAPPEAPARVDGTSGSADMSGTGMDTGAARHGGLSPWVFVSGAVVTAGLGGVTIWSGLDVLSAHDTYKKNPTESGYNDGRSRELRTNVLIGATSVVGVATGVIGLFFTDWSGKHAEKAERPGALHATASVTGNSAGILVGGVY